MHRGDWRHVGVTLSSLGRRTYEGVRDELPAAPLLPSTSLGHSTRAFDSPHGKLADVQITRATADGIRGSGCLGRGGVRRQSLRLLGDQEYVSVNTVQIDGDTHSRAF